MVANPCCCCTLQTGTKIVAIVNIISSAILLLLTVLGLFGLAVGAAAYASSDERAKNPENDQVFAAAGVIVLVFGVLTIICMAGYLVVCIVLLLGANQRHYGKCKIWFIISLILLVLYAIKNLYETVSYGQQYGAGAAITNLLGLLIGGAIGGWQIWTVFAFMEEIKNEGTPAGQAGYVHAKQNEEA